MDTLPETGVLIFYYGSLLIDLGHLHHWFALYHILILLFLLFFYPHIFYIIILFNRETRVHTLQTYILQGLQKYTFGDQQRSHYIHNIHFFIT